MAPAAIYPICHTEHDAHGGSEKWMHVCAQCASVWLGQPMAVKLYHHNRNTEHRVEELEPIIIQDAMRQESIRLLWNQTEHVVSHDPAEKHLQIQDVRAQMEKQCRDRWTRTNHLSVSTNLNKLVGA